MAPDLALVLISDVDGTLLDDTYSPARCAEILATLRERRVPVVLCSSKTRSELERLRREWGNADPFIVESGAALFIPDGYFPLEIPGSELRDGYVVLELARPYSQAISLLEYAATQTGVAIARFGTMTPDAIAAETGLPLELAILAGQREYDEPFRVVDPDPGARGRLFHALQQLGMRPVEGGRYDHAVLGADKGLAAAFVRRLYRKAFGPVTTVGLGDAMIDVPLLRAVDVPVIVRGAADVVAQLKQSVPWAKVTRLPGPAGWREEVRQILDHYVKIWDGSARDLHTVSVRPAAPTR